MTESNEPTLRQLELPERGAAGGVEIALLDWGGDGPLVLMHHANGFCAGTLGLVAQGLRSQFRVVGMDARGHGDSSKPEGPDAYTWDHFAEDYLAVAEQLVAELGCERVAVGLGHSFGGTSVLGAAARRPELFERLVLVDPVIPVPASAPVDARRSARLARLIDGARRRRVVWPSRDAAIEHFETRPLFEDWLPAALDLYVDHGLRLRPSGEMELKCPGAVEAAVFEQGAGVDVAALARHVSVPTTVLWATRGDFPRAVYERVFGGLEHVRIVDVDSGHLVPMERPEQVVAAVLKAGEGG